MSAFVLEVVAPLSNNVGNNRDTIGGQNPVGEFSLDYCYTTPDLKD